MKPKYFHSLLVMILMFWVLMMVTNASEKIDQDLELNNGNVTKKEEKVSERREFSFTPILKTEFQMNRRIHLWAIASAYKFSPNLIKMIFTYLDPVPVSTKLQDLNSDNAYTIVSRDGNLMLTADFTCSTLFLSDLTAETRVRTFTSHEIESGSIISCTIADSNAFIACGTVSGKIYIWNTISSELMTILVGHTKLVDQCCIFSNDTRIASASSGDTFRDETIRLWNIETDSYSCVYVLNYRILPGDFVEGLLVSAKHARIFVPIHGEESGRMIHVWNDYNKEWLQDIGKYARSGGNPCVLSDDEDQCIGYVNEQDEITIWNFMTNECTKRISIAHDGSTNRYQIGYFSSKRLVWYIAMEKVGLYDFEKNTQVYILPVKVRHVTVSENGKYLMIIRWDEENDEFFLEVYWLDTGKLKN